MVQVAESRDRSNREQHSSASAVWTCHSPYKGRISFEHQQGLIRATRKKSACGINLFGRIGTLVNSRGRTLTTNSWASTRRRHQLPPRLGRNVGADGHLRNTHKKYLMTSRVSSRHLYGKETTCFMVRCYAPFCGKCATATITFTACEQQYG